MTKSPYPGYHRFKAKERGKEENRKGEKIFFLNLHFRFTLSFGSDAMEPRTQNIYINDNCVMFKL